MTHIELDLGQWNGKVYGRREYNSCNIYLGKSKVNITNEEADALEAMNYIPVWNRKAEVVVEETVVSSESQDEVTEAPEAPEAPVMICTFAKDYKKRQYTSRKNRGFVFYEDEFNAALGMRG